MSNALAEKISELSYEDQLDLLMFIVSSLKSKKKNVEECCTTFSKALYGRSSQC